MPSVQFDAQLHFPNTMPKCPLCTTPADIYRLLASPDLFEGRCEVCGDVNITVGAVDLARREKGAHFVSAVLKKRPADRQYPALQPEDVERILRDAPSYSALERLDLTLTQVDAKSERPGSISRFSHAKDYPLVCASSPDEALFFLRELDKKGYIRLEHLSAIVTMPGYERLQF